MSKPNLFVRVLLRVIRMRVLLRLAVRLAIGSTDSLAIGLSDTARN
jgi:hypothetical protein